MNNNFNEQDNYKKNYYAIIPAEVRYDKRLKPLARLLYGEITALTNDKGYCWATNNYFANLYSISSATVSRYISQLKEYGYITIDYKIKNNNIDKRKIYLKTIQNNKVLTKLTREYKQNNQTGIGKKVKDNNIINNTINDIDKPLSEFDLFVKELTKTFNEITCNEAKSLSQIHCFKKKEKQEELMNIFNNRKFDWKECIKYAKSKIQNQNNITTLWLDFISYLKVYLINGDKENLIKRYYSEKELIERENKLKEIKLIKLQKEKEEREKMIKEEKILGIENITEDEIIDIIKNKFKHLQRNYNN
ncbi:helix-turn-helix domain-containing protein [Brachyspira pulli]|uniref:helix-turn-helix domain-containing protein n=1 Tax=Brachyspira pulli TaxID=310721 RepID=UPI00300755BE